MRALFISTSKAGRIVFDDIYISVNTNLFNLNEHWGLFEAPNAKLYSENLWIRLKNIFQ